MNKKKLGALLITGALTLGVIGGSFAWFTSSSTATNKFATQGGNEENKDDKDAGIEIWEKFDAEEAAKLTPGGTIDKKVQFKSNVDYDQFVRVKITPQWTQLLGTKLETPEAAKEELNLELDNVVESFTSVKEGQWIKEGDYYYYIGIVPANAYTTQLLDVVKFNGEVDSNNFKNSKFDVEIQVESVQATNDAILSQWKGVNKELLEKINGSEEVTGVIITGAKEVSGEQSKGNTGLN